MGSRQSGHSTTGALCSTKPSQSHSLDASQSLNPTGSADAKRLSETQDAASGDAGSEGAAVVRPAVPSVVVVEPTSRGREQTHVEPQVCEIRVHPPTPIKTPSESPPFGEPRDTTPGSSSPPASPITGSSGPEEVQEKSQDVTGCRTAPSAPPLPDDTSPSEGPPAITSKPQPASTGHTSNADSTDSAERRPFRPSAPDLPSYEDAVIASLAPNANGDSRTPKTPGAAPRPSALPRVRDVRVGVNLVRAAGKLLTFLATVDAHPALYSGPLVTAALRR